MIYLDNAATSAVRPARVKAAISRFLDDVGASPGRSAHRLAVEAGRIVFECREALVRLLGAADSDSIVFTPNATHALNIAFLGLLREGDRVVTTSMEHNSVMRPLKYMHEQGFIKLTILQCDNTGQLRPIRIERALTPEVRMFVMTHASNVTGTLMPVEEASDAARKAGVLFVLDAAQTAGVYPIDVQKPKIDILACSGHKGLLGPHGTGVLYVREGIEIEPVYRGGTGSDSEKTQQPDFMPDKLECGTHNAVGIAGLKAGVEFILEETVQKIREHEMKLAASMLEGLSAVEGVVIHGPHDPEKQTAVVAFNIAGRAASEVGLALDREFDIAVRVGLHCSPAAHSTLGTFPKGTVRASAGYLNTQSDVDALVSAMKQIAARKE